MHQAASFTVLSTVGVSCQMKLRCFFIFPEASQNPLFVGGWTRFQGLWVKPSDWSPGSMWHSEGFGRQSSSQAGKFLDGLCHSATHFFSDSYWPPVRWEITCSQPSFKSHDLWCWIFFMFFDQLVVRRWGSCVVMRMLGQKWPALLQVPSEAVAVGEGLLMFEMHL